MKKISLLLLLCGWMASCQTQTAEIQTLDATAFNEAVKSNEQIQLIDVRTPEEFQSGHLESAVNINSASPDFEAQLNKLDKSKPVYVYCKGGGRSAAAAQKLVELGFTDVKDMKGGMMAYVAAGLAQAEQKGMSIADYNQILAQNKYLLVDFYADWCAPCKKMAPYLAQIEQDLKGQLKLAKINADEHESLAEQLQVEGLPYLVLYKNGEKVWEHLGFIAENELRQTIQKHQ